MDRKRAAFCAHIELNLPGGRTTHLVEVFELSPIEQQEMLMRAIVGYDAPHPDGPGEQELKFKGPVASP